MLWDSDPQTAKKKTRSTDVAIIHTTFTNDTPGMLLQQYRNCEMPVTMTTGSCVLIFNSFSVKANVT